MAKLHIYHIETGWYRNISAQVFINDLNKGSIAVGQDRIFDITESITRVYIEIKGQGRSETVTLHNVKEDEKIILCATPMVPDLVQVDAGFVGAITGAVTDKILRTSFGGADTSVGLRQVSSEWAVNSLREEYRRSSQQRGGCFLMMAVPLVLILFLLAGSAGDSMMTNMILFAIGGVAVLYWIMKQSANS